MVIEPERRAVAGRVEDQRVLAPVHQLGDPGERQREAGRRAARQPARRRCRRFRPARSSAPARHSAACSTVAGLARLAAEHRIAVERDRDDIGIDRARAAAAAARASARSSLRCSSSSAAGARSRSICDPRIGMEHQLERARHCRTEAAASVPRRLIGLRRSGRRRQGRAQACDQLHPAAWPRRLPFRDHFSPPLPASQDSSIVKRHLTGDIAGPILEEWKSKAFGTRLSDASLKAASPKAWMPGSPSDCTR